MSIKEKTIGPMTRDSDRNWELPSNRSVFLCNYDLRAYFNIPRTATKLWITLTQHDPKDHRDAIRVRFNDARLSIRLAKARKTRHYIVPELRYAAAAFGDDFYATIYYK